MIAQSGKKHVVRAGRVTKRKKVRKTPTPDAFGTQGKKLRSKVLFL